ncbi:MAG: hypothetical protein PHS63_08540, partial [Desulfoplanes sp.]|nr:hypothetical protein [Desulfoplanes sp.]
MKRMRYLAGWILLLLLPACTGPVEIARTINELLSIFPDYREVTIPPNIAPLNFKLSETTDQAQAAIFETDGMQFEVR